MLVIGTLAKRIAAGACNYIHTRFPPGHDVPVCTIDQEWFADLAQKEIHAAQEKDTEGEAVTAADPRARVAELEQALKRVACYAATAQDENAPEWMAGLVDHLNQAAVTLNQPTQFVLHKTRADGHLWITAETIP